MFIENLKSATSLGFAIAVAMTFSVGAMGQGIDGDQDLSYDAMDIDGNYNRPSVSDKIQKYREELMRKNEDAVRQKIENQRVEAEKRLGADLKNMFAGGLKGSPAKSEQKVPAKKEETTLDPERKTRILPTIGLSTIKGDGFDYESSLAGGVAVESMVWKNISAGVAFDYKSIDITDVSNSLYQQYYITPNGFFPFSGFSRKMNYKSYALDLYGKYYISTGTMVTPYAGAGLGYARSSFQYEDKVDPSTFPQYQNEVTYSNSFFNGIILAGTDVKFTKSIGLNVEFKYKKALNAGTGNNSNQLIQGFNGDQLFLNELGGRIDSSHFMTLNIGVAIYF